MAAFDFVRLPLDCACVFPRPPPTPTHPHPFCFSHSHSSPPPAPSSTSPLIVSLVDGTVLAVDPATGATLWRFDTGSPLVSAAGLGPGERPWAEGEGGGGGGGGPGAPAAASMGVIPGAADGALYAYSVGDGAGLARLPGASVPALAAAGATLTADGGVVLGAVRTTVYLLDPLTGALVRAFTAGGGGGEAAAAEVVGEGGRGGRGWEGLLARPGGADEGGGGGRQPPPPRTIIPDADGAAPGAAAPTSPPPPRRPLALARHDYSVRAVDAATGAPRWNVSWGRLARLGGAGGGDARRPAAAAAPAATTAGGGGGGVSPAAGDGDDDGTLSTAEPRLWGVVAGGDGTLSLGHGARAAPPGAAPAPAAWSTLLPSPAVAAFDGTGAALPLSLSGERGGGGGGGGRGGGSLVVVGEVEGTRFALPAPPGAVVASSAAGIAAAAGDGSPPIAAALPLGVHALLPAGGGSAPPPALVVPAPLPLPPAAAARPPPSAAAALLSLARSAMGGAALLLAAGAAVRVARGAAPPAAAGKDEEVAAAAAPAARAGAGVDEGGGGAGGDDAMEVDEAVAVAAPLHQPPQPPPPRPPSTTALIHPRLDLGGGAFRVGRLTCGPDILGYGSGGTLVFAGHLAGAGGAGDPGARPVAVKRVLRQFAGAAATEAAALVASDAHPSIVRCHAVEEDAEFIYLALERCAESLADAVARPAGRAALVSPADGRPTPLAREVCRSVTAGLAALHARGIVHRDLKPANVLLTRIIEAGAPGGGGAPEEAGSGGAHHREEVLAKVSDMGLAKRLPAGATSFEPSRPAGEGGGGRGGAGSAGWTAPELLERRAVAAGAGGGGGGAGAAASPLLVPAALPPLPPRHNISVDTFSLGLLIYHTLTGGEHPYGPPFERDFNILRGRASTGALSAKDPEGGHLVRAATALDPASRPPASALLTHPFWWSAQRRLSFLTALSDRVELEDRVAVGGGGGGGGGGGAQPAGPAAMAATTTKRPSPLLAALEAEAAPPALGRGRGAARPPWTARLDPALLAPPATLRGPPRRLYDGRSLRDLLRLVRNKAAHFAELAPAVQARVGAPPSAYVAHFTDRFPGLLLACYAFAGRHCGGEAWFEPWWGDGAHGGAAAAAALIARWPAEVEGGVVGEGLGVEVEEADRVSAAVAAATAAAAAWRPPTAGGQVADDGQPLGGLEVVGAPPPPPATPAEPLPAAATPTLLDPATFPARPGAPACSFYVKTGHCRFGGGCAFDHPAAAAVPRTAAGLPIRRGEPQCSFFQRTGACKFGPACKFDHS